MKHQHEERYSWVPARISPEVYDKIDAIARDMHVRRHEVVSAAVNAGLNISPYRMALDKVRTEKRMTA